jgi:uncharacterized protein DUF4349
MSMTWGSRFRLHVAGSRKYFKAGWLVTAGIVALYVGAIRPYEVARDERNSRETGLASSRGWSSERVFPRKLAPIANHLSEDLAAVHGVAGGVVGGVPGGGATNASHMAMLSVSPQLTPAQDDSADRKMIRTSSIDMLVQHPAEAAEKIRTLAERVGGFLVSSEMRGEQDATNGSLTIRVPAAHFEEVRTEIRKLGLRVESEKIEAQDITRQYVDQEANLRNLRAEEAQYLGILKQAHTVKDTIEVSEKLSDVRGQIDQQQAEFNALSKQIETVAITVSLRAEAEARVFGLNWRPLYQMKMAFRDGLDGLGDYASAMTSFLFYLPAVLLWLATILVGAALGWRLVRWAGRRVFGWGAVKSTEAVV